MKKFISKVQNLSQKASELQKALHSVPPKIAELRESVAMTATQLQQLRANVQSSVADLRMDNPDRVVEALQEINDHAAVFEEAGYVLHGVDMELSPVQRLIVHLRKIEDVPHGNVRNLITTHEAQTTVHALLSALLQAEAVADRVSLTQLQYGTLIVNVGPIPAVRLCWRTEAEEEVLPATAAMPSPQASAPAPVAPAASAFTQTSYFAARPATVPSPALPPSPAIPAVVVSPALTALSPQDSSSGESAAPASTVDWKQEALERLKKNPHQSKYSR
jgi:hypothetical protein